MANNQLVKVDPNKLVTDYSRGFSRLLPSHMREDGGGDQWVAAVKSLLATRPEVEALLQTIHPSK